MSDGSLYIPTPEHAIAIRMMGNVSPIDLPNKVGFIELPLLEIFSEAYFGGVQPRDAKEM